MLRSDPIYAPILDPLQAVVLRDSRSDFGGIT